MEYKPFLNPFPKMKVDVAVSFESEPQRFISFYAPANAAKLFEKFGDVHSGGHSNEYFLYVDPRFNYGEVLAFIKASARPIID